MRVLIILTTLASIALASPSHHHEAILTSAPITTYTTTHFEPQTSYEYSSNVNTHDYNNHVHVKSNIHEPTVKVQTTVAAAAPTIVEQPIVHTVEPIIEAKTVPLVYAAPTVPKYYSHVPIVKAANLYHHEPLVHAVHTPIAAVPQTYYAKEFYQPTYFKHVPAAYVKSVGDASSHFVQHEEEVKHQESSASSSSAVAKTTTIIKPQESIVAVKHVEQPTVLLKHEPFVHHVAAPIVHHATPIIHHEPNVIVKHYEPTVTAAVHHGYAAPIVESVVEDKIVGDAVVAEGILAKKSQYHSQNILGEATYGHSEPTQVHNAVQDAAGNKAGSFSYVASDGRVLTTDYIADEHGYRAATNALPILGDDNHHYRHRRSLFATAPVASIPLLREQTHTSIVHNPGHASSYRIDTVDHVPEIKTVHHTTVPAVKTILTPEHHTTVLASTPVFYSTPYGPASFYSNHHLLSHPIYTPKTYVEPLTYSTIETVPAAEIQKETATFTKIIH